MLQTLQTYYRVRSDFAYFFYISQIYKICLIFLRTSNKQNFILHFFKMLFLVFLIFDFLQIFIVINSLFWKAYTMYQSNWNIRQDNIYFYIIMLAEVVVISFTL